MSIIVLHAPDNFQAEVEEAAEMLRQHGLSVRIEWYQAEPRKGLTAPNPPTNDEKFEIRKGSLGIRELRALLSQGVTLFSIAHTTINRRILIRIVGGWVLIGYHCDYQSSDLWPDRLILRRMGEGRPGGWITKYYFAIVSLVKFQEAVKEGRGWVRLLVLDMVRDVEEELPSFEALTARMGWDGSAPKR
ncbi:MAG: hypothetical protein HY429_00875 [Candidatus Levybacteria bacterium]|nr:hypothetical protein [Candidatus Levybacteria bacterium]